MRSLKALLAATLKLTAYFVVVLAVSFSTVDAAANAPTKKDAMRNLVTEVARENGIDPAAFLRMAQIESGFDPLAFNKHSKAAGLFQFIPSTAKAYNLANPFDARANAEAAARLWQDNARALRKALGREPSAGEVYLAHQQGAGGAIRLLKQVNRPAAEIVGRRAVTLNGGRADMTAGEFAGLWTKRFAGL